MKLKDEYFLNLRTSEIHLFYNLQLFYWHFLDVGIEVMSYLCWRVGKSGMESGLAVSVGDELVDGMMLREN